MIKKMVSALLTVASTILARIVLAMILCVPANALFAQERKPERLLPIRGEQLLQSLRTRVEPPVLTNLSVSPDGAWGVYWETTRKHPSDPADNRAVVKRIWLIDTMSGRKVLLSNDAADQETGFAPVEDLAQRWSPDGRRVALLEKSKDIKQDKAQKDVDVLALTIWRADRPDTPIRTQLPPLALGTDADGKPFQLINWMWFAERGEVWLEFKPESQSRTLKPTGSPVGGMAWSWLLSAAPRPQFVPPAPKPSRRIVIDLARQTIRQLPADSAIGNRPGSSTWTLASDRRSLFTSTRDPRHQFYGPRRSFQMWALHTGDRRGQEWNGMQSSLLALDVQSGLAQPRYVGGPGRIADMVELAGGTKLLLVEETPQLSLWPLDSNYGRLRVVGTPSVPRDVPGEPVLLDTRVFAGADAERALLWERNERSWTGTSGGTSRLDELDITTGKRRDLLPSELSAVSVDVSADGRTILAVLEGVDTPPDVHVWTMTTRRWRPLTEYGMSRPRSGEGRMEWRTWRSRDNLWDVTGILVRPPGFVQNHRYPLLVCMQGGSTSGTISNDNTYDPMVQGGCGVPAHILAAEGYLVLLPNHRQVQNIGYTANRALIGHYGDQIPLDVEAGVDALIESGIADPDRVGVLGHSHGSDEVAYAISHSRRYQAAVINDGPPLWEIQLPRSALWRDAPTNAERRETLTRLMGYDPVQRPWADVFEIRTPLLVRWSAEGFDVHEFSFGENRFPYGGDNRAFTVPQTVKLYYALSSNRVPMEVLVDRDGHGIDTPKYRLEYQSRLLQWFDYFLLDKGENPIPAMRFPLDYADEDKKYPLRQYWEK